MANMATVKNGSARLPLLKVLAILRHHPGHQHDDDHKGHGGHDGRVEHGAQHLGAQGLLLFLVVRQALEHRAQRAALLTGGHHGAVDVVKLTRCGGQARAKLLPALTSLLRCATSSRWRSFSLSSASAVRARSRGNPLPTKAGQLAASTPRGRWPKRRGA